MSTGDRRGWAASAVAIALVWPTPTAAHADVDLSMYGDVDGAVRTTGSRHGTEEGFSAAKLELFTTTTVGRWSFLAETLFEADKDNSFAFEVERVGVGYLYRDWLRVFVGRFHTALGYYNDAFHHGAYFMLPIGRPAMVEFEDGGGLIPAHNIGIHADGRLALGESHLRYDLELANGRAADPEEIQNAHDGNLPKAINARLRYEAGKALEGLIVGGNVYFDAIPGTQAATEASGTTALGPIHEWIVGAHASYFEHDLHLITEALFVQHTEVASGVRHRTYAAFIEAGHTFDKVTPYGRYQWTRLPDEGDPYYRRGAADNFQAVSLGVKHATTDNIALKAEATVTSFQAAGVDRLFTLVGQVAFAF